MKLKLSKKKEAELIKKFGHVPTEEEILEKIKASQERLMSALAGALKTAPDDPKIRKQLLEAVEKAAKLRGEVYEKVLKEKPPEIKMPETAKELQEDNKVN